ncbi:hypothetical protein HIO71_13920 [Chryseobacterium aquaticum]|uniref:Uncharacterized protein n=1 Tax=Chryseobacterium aquaticum TaxID=452084 RepID=A0A848N9Q8_9FLAO|nr:MULTISPECIES: hypothetical protein [Chryseobacterium]NMR35280.1 hypothetical protein [Chryseobacterium aquaticum]NRQ47282.1 hypothetical protein [Chryseobacterium sp. C-204]
MKKSIKPTEYFLIKAKSEWDDCDFAIIHITEEWKKIQKKRLEVVKIVKNDSDLKWLNYEDVKVEFFKFSKENYPQIEEWLSGKNQFFVELEKDDLKQLLQPEHDLHNRQMQVFKSGNAIYNAFGKHTSEEFFTEEFSLEEFTK